MRLGTKWLRRAEQAGAERGWRLIDAAERELTALLPGARIEREAGEIRVSAQALTRRWIAEPALRFLLRNLR